MKILLINPPALNTLASEVPSIVGEERGHNPPLGIMYIASVLEKDPSNEVEILDAQLDELNYAQLKEEIILRNPDVVGMTVMTFTLIDCIITARMAKEANKKIKIIIGGIHPNIFQNETINLPEIDYIVLGEGEVAIPKLIKSLDKGKSELKKIKGIIFKYKGKIIHTGNPDLIKNLDEVPFPARHLTEYQKYSSLLAKRSPVTTMITSRGCPFRCLFCDRPHLGKVFRARSAKNVVDEMEECAKMGIKEFLIYDDTFTINKQRVLDICDEIIKRDLNIGWDIRARVDTVDEEMLKKMHEAGCERIHYGVEAGNKEILQVLRKGITLEQAERAFKITRKAKIDTLAYFMIGSPRETKETILDTINFAKRLKPGFVHFSITTPFPATALYYLALEEGIIKKDVWKEFAENPMSAAKTFRAPLWEENLKKEELFELLTYAYKNFYKRPSYILKKLFKIRSFDELKRKVRAGLKVFKL